MFLESASFLEYLYLKKPGALGKSLSVCLSDRL